jgi:formylmethanofuran dehydrogenase subunit E-like metal-binding protein
LVTAEVYVVVAVVVGVVTQNSCTEPLQSALVVQPPSTLTHAPLEQTESAPHWMSSVHDCTQAPITHWYWDA